MCFWLVISPPDLYSYLHKYFTTSYILLYNCIYAVYNLQSDYDAKTKRLEETLNAVVRKVTEMDESLHVLARKTGDIEDSLNVQMRDLAVKIDIMKKESDHRKIELERKLAVSL